MKFSRPSTLSIFRANLSPLRRGWSYVTVLLLFIIASCTTEEPYDVTEEYQAAPVTISDDEISFLHISDTHGSMLSLGPACDYLMLSPCSFALLSGDICATEKMKDCLQKCEKPFLLTPGNHDINEGGEELLFRREMIDPMQKINQAVLPADDVNYWYRDFQRGGHRLRVIGIDQFQFDHFSEEERQSSSMYTQQQADWLANTLNEAADYDGVIIMMHMGFGNRNLGCRDTSREGEFTSIYARNYPNSYDYAGSYSTLLVPDIVEAYITGNNLSGKRYLNANPSDYITVTTTYPCPHENFIGYFGGHTHWDVVETLTGYPRQLQSIVAFGGEGNGGKWNDLVKTGHGVDSFTINLCTIDFAHRTLTIRRLGSQRKVDGTLRQQITFSY
ncbi:MAG: metallophosphoesterase [Prevotella sp.]|nr:metallophosphoesterase [Prevotella sp.]